jgi:type II secretory ATPase GspE/PulE/Tfp pilus assembly ATPase PilB-like protein
MGLESGADFLVAAADTSVVRVVQHETVKEIFSLVRSQSRFTRLHNNCCQPDGLQILSGNVASGA